jgi:drug/metabolite transporter, DME family
MTVRPARSARSGYLLALSSAAVWSLTSPGISYLIETHGIDPLVVAFWRDALVAAACLAAIGIAVGLGRRAAPQISGGDWRGFLLTGIFSIGIYHALFATSIALNGAALGIVLIYLYPAFVTLGAALFFKEPIGLRQLAALALALTGCVLLVRAYDPAVLRVSWQGILIGIGSALTHAGYVLFSQRAVERHSPWLTLGMTMLFGALTLLIISGMIAGPAQIVSLGSGWTPLLVLIGLSLGPTLFGYALFTFSLRHLPGRIISVIMVVEAPIATLLAVLLLGERLEALQVAGIAAILAAAVLTSWNSPAATPVPAE